MAIRARIFRLFKADVHSILDSLEDPKAVLAQAIRDMQECLIRDEERTTALKTEALEFGKRIKEAELAHTDVLQKVELCIRNRNDMLAKATVRKKLETERFLGTLHKRMAATTDELAHLSAQLTQKRAKLAEYKEKAALFVENAGTDRDRDDLPSGLDGIVVSDADVEVALMAEKERLLGENSRSSSAHE